LLRAEGFSLRGNATTVEGRRTRTGTQFRYFNEQAKDYQGIRIR
jgi:hypothetical protein